MRSRVFITPSLWLLQVLAVLVSVSLPVMAAADFSGRVVTVIDGDTVRVLTSKRIIKVRLYGIDCPEKKQPFGKEAKKALRQRVFGKVVNFQERDKARDGLAVAVLMTPDGRDINRELVQAGSCWALEDHVADYSKDMQEAREARRGLWQDPNPISPENWRRIKQRKGKAEKLPVIPGEIGTEPPTEF